MNTVSIILALLALAGLLAVWFRLVSVKAKLDALESIHPSSDHAHPGQMPVALPSFFSTKPPEDNGEAAFAVNEKLIILGYLYETIVIDNQPNGNLAVKSVQIEMPRGTTHVVPSIKGFVLCYGERLLDGEGQEVWSVEDHHLGIENVDIHVMETGEVLTTLEVSMQLRDRIPDDRWCGAVRATILFLGTHP